MTTTVLVGCGHMGRALVEGWLQGGMPPSDLRIVEPNSAGLPSDGVWSGVWRAPDASGLDLDGGPINVVLAVKPAMAEAALGALPPLPAGSLLISILAGRALTDLGRLAGPQTAVIRAIPNLPAAIRKGVTAVAAGPTVSDRQRDMAESLLEALGDVVWLEREELIDVATAVSGSGPAYVFLLAESMIATGQRMGLDPETARRLTLGAIAGSGLLAQSSDKTPEALRVQVTSPKGTTLAALEILMGPGGIPDLIDRALAAGAARSKELGAS